MTSTAAFRLEWYELFIPILKPNYIHTSFMIRVN